MAKIKHIVGRGGGGSSGGHEDSDTLFSKSKLKVIELLGEGEIEGLVDGEKSIYLNDVPVTGSDGKRNFVYFKYDERKGTPHQDAFADFDSTPTPIVLENWWVTHDTARSIYITDPDIDKVRVIIQFPNLMNGAGGNITRTKVEFRVRLYKEGVSVLPDNLTKYFVDGKSSSSYEFQCMIDLTEHKPASNFQIEVSRITPDSTSVNLQNKMKFYSYSLIRSVKLSYPNSALMKIEIDPEEFTSAPARSYHVKGLRIQVPSNYNPDNTTPSTPQNPNPAYSGPWNGTLTTKYSNNPAWVMFDLLTNPRYGLGIDPANIDVFQLYSIGQYCDQTVDDGYGGTNNERRFAINTVIQSRVEAYKLITDLSSVFRGMTYWANGMVGFTQDVPKEPTMVFNCTNVVNGEFNYTSSPRKNRHNVVLVTWNDPKNNYKKTIEYVEDHKLIESMNEIRQIEIIAFGCTSRGQAHRAGRWVLLTEAYETNMVSFKVGMDSALVLPGEIVKIQDAYRAGRRLSGRVKSRSSDGLSIVLDAPISIESANATLDIKTASGSIAHINIQNGVGVTDTLSLQQAVPELADDAVYIVSEPGLVAMTARVVGIAQDKETGGFVISALQYQTDKFDKIENDNALLVDPIGPLSDYSIDPYNLSFVESQMTVISPGVISSEVTVSWQGRANEWVCRYRISKGQVDSSAPMGFRLKDGEIEGDWIPVKTAGASFIVDKLVANNIIDVEIFGVSKSGKKTDTTLVGSYLVKGKDAIPNPPTNLNAVGGIRNVTLHWTPPTDLDLKEFLIYRQDSSGAENEVTPVFSDIPNREPYVSVSAGTISFVDQLPKGLMSKYYWVRAKDTTGNISEPNAMAGTKGMSLYENSDIMDLIFDASKKIHDSQLYSVLGEGIKFDIWGTEGLKILYQQLENQTADEYFTNALQNNLINIRGLAENLIDANGRININDTKIYQLTTNGASQSKRIDTIAVADKKGMAGILAIYDAILSDKQAMTTYLFNMVSRLNQNFGEISSYRNILATNTSVAIDAIDTIVARIRENNMEVSSLLRHEITSRTTMEQAFQTQIDTMGVSYTNGIASINAEIIRQDGVIINKDVARAKDIGELRAEMVGLDGNGGKIGAVVQDIKTASIGYCVIGGSPDGSYDTKLQCESAGGVWMGGDRPFAQILNTASIATEDGSKATVQQQLVTLRGVLGVDKSGNKKGTGITSAYTLKIQNGNVVTGFGLMYDTNESSPTSRFLIRANSFAIARDSDLDTLNPTGIEPFVVDANTGFVYIDNAMIKTASITTAQIAGTIMMAPKVYNAPRNLTATEPGIHVSPYVADGQNSQDLHENVAYEMSITVEIPPAPTGSSKKATISATAEAQYEYYLFNGPKNKSINVAVDGQWSQYPGGYNDQTTQQASQTVFNIDPGRTINVNARWLGQQGLRLTQLVITVLLAQ